jgi:hypothetical protein
MELRYRRDGIVRKRVLDRGYLDQTEKGQAYRIQVNFSPHEVFILGFAQDGLYPAFVPFYNVEYILAQHLVVEMHGGGGDGEQLRFPFLGIFQMDKHYFFKRFQRVLIARHGGIYSLHEIIFKIFYQQLQYRAFALKVPVDGTFGYFVLFGDIPDGNCLNAMMDYQFPRRLHYFAFPDSRRMPGHTPLLLLSSTLLQVSVCLLTIPLFSFGVKFQLQVQGQGQVKVEVKDCKNNYRLKD